MNLENENYMFLKEFALAQSASLFGVADVSGKKEYFNIYPPELLSKMNRAVSIGYHLSDAVMETIIDKPNRLYYRHYKMANMFLDQVALKIGEQIQRKGYNYIPIPASQMLEWKVCGERVSHASHRAIAQLAGLGWRGRNSLLVNPKYGSRARYVSILTDLPLKADKPMEADCGKCKICMGMCPAGAITEQGYDLEACHQLLQGFGKTLHVSLICGVCQKACRGNNPLVNIKEQVWEK
ncbi:MAG: hypothetical protein ACLFQV_05070 [Vulcanimicrobiota bacterium]